MNDFTAINKLVTIVNRSQEILEVLWKVKKILLLGFWRMILKISVVCLGRSLISGQIETTWLMN